MSLSGVECTWAQSKLGFAAPADIAVVGTDAGGMAVSATRFAAAGGVDSVGAGVWAAVFAVFELAACNTTAPPLTAVEPWTGLSADFPSINVAAIRVAKKTAAAPPSLRPTGPAPIARIELPHFGHVAAVLLISVRHSLQFISAINFFLSAISYVRRLVLLNSPGGRSKLTNHTRFDGFVFGITDQSLLKHGFSLSEPFCWLFLSNAG